MRELANLKAFEHLPAKLTLVEFYAPWCNRCPILEDVLVRLAKQSAFKDIAFCKVDVQKVAALVEQYHIMSVPTLIFFVDGVAKEKITGYKPENELAKYLQEKIKEND